MELPEEDYSALAKRRAIQALMKDKTLTPSERSARMQDIIKGNFTDPGPIVAPARAEAKDGAPRESVSTQKSKLSASVQPYGSSSSEEDDSSSSSSCSSSYSSASSYTRDDESSKSSGRSNNRPASKAIANTEATSSISVGTGSGTRHSQSSSTVDPRNEAWEYSNLSASTYGMEEKESKTVEQQKERQRKLLEISRNTSLTSDERSLQIKAVMKTNVEEEVRRTRRGNMRESLSINESISIPFDDTESLLWEGESRRSLLNLSSGQIANEMTHLIQRLKNNDATLTELDLEKRRLGDEDVIPLFDAFGDNTLVSSLNLASNRIGNEGCSALASAILDNTSLTLIDLSGNNIGDEGIEDLCKVIPYNKTLSQLNLADNKIGDSGASELAGSLVDNTSLLHINLNGNFIGDEGATDIFKVLATTNSTLQSLLLRMNGITDRGASALASALIENETIVSIDLGQNRIGNKGGTDLLKVLSCNETIEEMKLDGNKNVDQEVLLEIQRQLNCCESSSEEEEDGSQNRSEYSSEEDVSGNDRAEGYPMTTRRISSNYEISDKEGSNNENDSDSEVEELGMNMQQVNENATAKEASYEGSEEEAVSTLYAGEAMLVDMPNEDSLTHSKRKAIQAVMQKEDLSAVERNGQIQDIMAGKVEAPKADPTQPAVEPREDSGSIERANTKLDYTTTEHSNAINKAISTLEMSDASLNNGHIFQRKVSYEYGTHTAIAYEWKQKMMAVHPKSHDNKLDVLLAHKYRLSLRSAPNQSSFRVVAVVFFAVAKKEDRFHVVGSNDEPNSVSGSICAERAALVQLRFVPDLEEITKIVIVTDDVDPISPGMLCREFMASFKKMPESTPILLGRAVCRNCGLNLSGKTCGDAKGIFDPTNHHLQDAHQKLFGDCLTKKGAKYSSPHDFIGSVISLPELFPYPSLYARLSAKDAFAYGQSYAARKALPKQNPNEGFVSVRPLTSSVRATRTESTVGSYKQERFDLSLISDSLSDDKPDTSSARKTPEPQVDRPSTSFSASLKTTVDLMRQIREDGDDNWGERGLNEMMPGILDHLKAKTLKISSRLKPSQRREKLMRLATEATTLEIPQRHIHPIRYGAGVLFSDGTVALASQKVALEYGCTLDAVGQLASVIDRKCVQLDEESLACKPVMIVQCDQFGVAHAPFAMGRSFLTERGYGDCKVLIHQQRSSKRSVRADESNTDLRLVEVPASDLAPSPPDIFGKVVTKNHSHGLQIEF